MNVQSFTLAIPQATLDDLRERLAHTRWPDEIESAGWDYGTNLAYLKELVDYWQHDFDWRAQEKHLNAFAHFRTEIDGLGIHFLHERGKGPNPIPLLLTHGWPDSFYRFHKIILDAADHEIVTRILGSLRYPLIRYQSGSILVPGRRDQSMSWATRAMRLLVEILGVQSPNWWPSRTRSR